MIRYQACRGVFYLPFMPATPDIITEVPLPPATVVDPLMPGKGISPSPDVAEASTPAIGETIPSDALILTQAYAARLRNVPMTVDDIEDSFANAFRNMADTDPQVSSSLDVLVLMALAQEMRLQPRVSKGESRYEDAELYTRFILAQLDRLDRSVQSINYEMDEGATVEGHKIAEIVLEWGPNFDPANDNPQLWLKAIKPKARDTYTIYVNAFNDWPGVLPVNALGRMPLSDEDLTKKLVARGKLMYRANHPRNSDPRGTSDLHDVWGIWWMNVQNWALLIQAHAQFAVPTAVFTEAPQGQAQWTRSDGRPMAPLEAAQAGLSVAKSVKSSAAVRLAFGQTLSYLQAASATEQCLKFRELVVREIEKAITNQQLATGTSQHQTGRAAETHQNVLGLKPRHHQVELAFMWEHDVFGLLLRLNYGDGAVALTPRVLLGQTQQWNLAAVGQMFAQMGANDLIMPSQFPPIHAGLDMPEAAREEYDRYTEYWYAKYDPKNAVPPKPGANGGVPNQPNSGGG